MSKISFYKNAFYIINCLVCYFISTNILFGNIYSAFLENKGQLQDIKGNPIPYVYFKTSSPGLDVYITKTGLTYSFINYSDADSANSSWERFDVSLVNANIDPSNIISENTLQVVNNYFLPQCPEGIMGVQSYKKITIKEVYPNIDWELTLDRGAFKYSFIIYPGGNYKNIKLRYIGAGDIKVENEDQITIKTPLNELQEGQLTCYYQQKNNLVNDQVPANYLTTSTSVSLSSIYNMEKSNKKSDDYFAKEVSISIDEPINKNKILVIDPPIEWSTLFDGGFQSSFQETTITDSENSLIISGLTRSFDFPVLEGDLDFYTGTFMGNGFLPSADIFITKFDSSGTLLWNTYYGGTKYDQVWASTVDSHDNIYLVGTTISEDFPLHPPITGYMQTYMAPDISITYEGSEGWILAFNKNSQRLWSTFFGGDISNAITAVTVDAQQNILISGNTRAENLFPLQNADGFFADRLPTEGLEMFIAKFNSSYELIWSTYYNDGRDMPNGHIYPNDIIVNNNEDIYIVGYTDQGVFPIVEHPGSFVLDTYGEGIGDGFIVKLNKAHELIWSTFFGGREADYIHSLAFDSEDNLFIIGSTKSDNFPIKNAKGYYNDPDFNGNTDAFLAKFNSNDKLLWSTYFGDVGGESPTSNQALYVDQCDNLYFAIEVQGSENMPVQEPVDEVFFDSQLDQGVKSDLYLGKFSSEGELTWATYFGSNTEERRARLTMDNRHKLYLTGALWNVTNVSELDNFPLKKMGEAFYDSTVTSDGAWDSHFFITRFNIPQDEFTFEVSDNTIFSCAEDSIFLLASGGGEYTWSTGDSSPKIIVSPMATTEYTISISGLYNGCIEQFDTTITVIDEGLCEDTSYTLFIPNAVADENPSFNPILLGSYDSYELYIYDRHGNLIFKTKDISERWKGLYRNKDIAANDVYIYRIIVNQKDKYSGNITVLR